MNYSEIIGSSFRGAACIKKDGEIFEYANGYRDFSNQLPNTIDTRFASASAGKVFVATGILQLIENKKLSFDDTLGTLLDINLNQIDGNVTVKELLNHTSGVPDYFDESVMKEYEDLWRDFPNYKIRHNSDLLPLFISKPMMYPRGTKFQYNNTGYVLLAMIIEKITGMEFDRYLQQNVFEPCGMTQSGYFELDRLPGNCAVNYVYCNNLNDFRTNIFCVDAKGTGAGGAFVTVKDIVRFWSALTEGRIISGDMFKTMISRQSGDGSDAEEGYYGFGMWIIDGKGQKDIPYFQGCDPGVSFISEYNPNTNTVSVFVSNYCDNVWAIARKLRQR